MCGIAAAAAAAAGAAAAAAADAGGGVFGDGELVQNVVVWPEEGILARVRGGLQEGVGGAEEFQ